MAMTKEEVFEVFRYYASKEFEDIPENESEIDCEFSDEFNKKMDKLLKRVSYDRAHIVSWTGKKILLIAAIIILMLSGIMSVGAIRGPVVELIYNIYEGFTEIFFDGDTTDKITYRYSFSEVPEGFVETQRISDDSINIVRYENKQTGDIIRLSQHTTYDSSFLLDNEHGYIKKIDVDGNEINIYINDYGDNYCAFWIENSNYLTLTYSGNTTVEEILNLINAIS